MLFRKVVFVFCLYILLSQWLWAQTSDTIRIMSYNTLNYGKGPSGSCPNLNTAKKHNWLKTITDYAQPDILGLVKMNSTPSTFATDSVLQKVLNVNCPNCYAASPYSNISGYSKVTGLYYRKAKFGYLGLTQVYTADPNIEDINLHRLFYKDPNLSQTRDTLYLNIILLRLQSNSGGSQTDRDNETAGIIQYLTAHVGSLKNHILMGDFNSSSANENCIKLFTNPVNRQLGFNDPANALGDWHNNPAQFATHLTHSSRLIDPGDCGSTGGMADRFDHILISDSLMPANLKRMHYVPGSLVPLGNDGLHTLNSITASPINQSAPTNVLNALYGMSNHLPVMLKMTVKQSPPTGVQTQNTNSNSRIRVVRQSDDHFIFRTENTGSERLFGLQIWGTDGRKVLETIIQSSAEGDGTFNSGILKPGVYIGILKTDGYNTVTFKIVNTQ